jgi:hypothetical protein
MSLRQASIYGYNKSEQENTMGMAETNIPERAGGPDMS